VLIKNIATADKHVENRESIYIVAENVNWCSHYEKQYEVSLKN
jgi:hypothetical protein